MATVTRETTESDVTYTITSIYPQIAFNALFTFIIYEGYFRYSLDGGTSYSEWDNLIEENLLAVNVDTEQTDIVVQFKTTLEHFALLISDTDYLLISDIDKLLIS
jgi:hypothetical protein